MNIKFRIESIFESNFYLKRVPPFFSQDIDGELLNYDVSFEIKIDEKKNILVAHTVLKAIYSDIEVLKSKVWPNSEGISDEDLQTFMKLGLTLTFNVNPLSKLISRNENQKELDVGLLNLVSEIVLSTARGIIFAKSQGSIVGENPLPYINAASFNTPIEYL